MDSKSKRNASCSRRPGNNRSLGFRKKLAGEQLESRALLATITVDTLIDENDGDIAFGDVSLRDAIAAAGSNDIIDFAVNGRIVLTEGPLSIGKKHLDHGGRERIN